MIGRKITLKKPMTFAHDSHYPSGMVDGAQIPQYFMEIRHELMTRAAGCQGRLRGFKSIDFTHPVWVGDVVEYEGWIESREENLYELCFEARIVQTCTDDFRIRYKYGTVKPETAKLKGYEGPMLCEPPVVCGSAVAVIEVLPGEARGAQDPEFEG